MFPMVGVYTVGQQALQPQAELMQQAHQLHLQLTRTAHQLFIGMLYHPER